MCAARAASALSRGSRVGLRRGPARSRRILSPGRTGGRARGRCVSLCLVSAVVVLVVRAANLRVRDDAIAAQPAEALYGRPPAVLISVEEVAQARGELANHVWSDRVIEHGGRAHLYRPAAEQKVVERVRKRGDSADAGEAAGRNRGRQLCHLRERLRQNGGAAQAAERDEAVDV